MENAPFLKLRVSSGRLRNDLPTGILAGFVAGFVAGWGRNPPIPSAFQGGGPVTEQKNALARILAA